MKIDLTPYIICRISVAFVWFYHGLFPKLLGPHEDELAMNTALGLSVENATRLAYLGGISEIFIAFSVLVFWRRVWPLVFTMLAMATLLLYSLIATPQLASAAFNPVTTNVCVFSLAWVAYVIHKKDGCLVIY